MTDKPPIASADAPQRARAGLGARKAGRQVVQALLGAAMLCAGPWAWAQCGAIPATYPITAGSNGVMNLNGTNYVNGLQVTGSGGKSVTMGAARTTAVPSSFPALVDVSTSASTTTLSNFTLGSGASYTFGSGNYVINNANLGSTVTLNVSAGTRLYLKGNISVGTSLRFNTAGPTVNGLVLLYPNANLTIGSGASFRGVIYGPGGGNNINLGAGSTITGLIALNSALALGDLTVNLSAADQSAIAALSTCSDSTAPTVTASASTCGDATRYTVSFSEPVGQASAETTGNYTVSNATVSSASLSSDSRTVTLRLASALTGSQTLTVRNVKDQAGNTMAKSTRTVSPLPLYAGLYGSYFSQNGNRDTVGTYAFTGAEANRVDRNIAFNWGTSAPGVGNTPAEGFSVRWTGVLKANLSGAHRFATGSDDGVRLYVNDTLLISNFSDHSYTVDVGTSEPVLTAGSYVPVVMEFYENATDARAELGWQQPGESGSNYYYVPAANLFNCTAAGSSIAGFSVVAASSSGSTCSPSTLTVSATDNTGAVLTTYTGTITLSTSSGRGSWAKGSSPTPAGSLVDNGNGSATYTFAAADAGVARFQLSHSLAQDVTVTAAESAYSGSSAAIQFRDNAFVFAEDLLGKVSGSDVAVAGRPHDMTLSLIKRDPSTGSCGVATDYSGSRALKLWRTDSGGSHTAPSIVSPALSIPASQPASNNLTLSFSNGVASFNLGSTDQGRYALNARDDSSVHAASAVTGSSNTITVRPFVVMVLFIKYGATANPNGSAATDAVLGPAGANFGATVAAYTWNAAMLTNGADPNNTGTPAANATEAAMKAGNRVNSFASTVNLTPLPGSQTPTSGVLGSLNNGSVPASAFSAGAGATTTLQYTEVGSFALKTTGVVSNFLGSGLALDAVVVNNAGLQNTRVGRFVPAGFVLSQGSAVLRSSAACTPASTFSYLGEPLQLGFTLTAVNALGATTTNYTGSYAKLGLSTVGNWNLAGIAGSTLFATSTSPARLSLGSSSGSWLNGVASGVSLSATPLRASAADGPFSTVWGIAPVDSDGVAMRSLDLDTSVPANSADRTQVATTALRLGRLRLQNAIGSQQRSLGLGVQAQYWNGSAWTDNTLDSCTRIPASSVNFGNLRKGLTTADSSVGSGTLTLSAGIGQFTLAAPGGGRSGTLDVALSLGSTATDASCLQPWTPGSGDAASAGANLAHLRGAWCGSSTDKDPSARASFGLFRGAEHLLHLRENY